MTDVLTLADNGVITVPGTSKRGPSNQGGGSKLKPCDLGGRHIVLKPGRIDTLLYWILKPEVFEYPKRYTVSCRYKTNHEQDPLKLQITKADEVIFESSIPIKDTGNEWVSSDPIELGCEIGGPPTVMNLQIVAPTIQGKTFYLKDWTFTPPGADDEGEYSATWFQNWLEELRDHAEDSVMPELLESDELTTSADHLQEAMAEARSAKGDDIDEAKVKVNAAYDECMAAAMPLLEKIDTKLAGFTMDDNLEFLQCLVVHHATPVKLADYCREGSEKAERLMHFLKEDKDTLKQVILAGGANGGFYGKMLDILSEIRGIQTEGKTILPKLALACAMELCSPLHEFDKPDVFVDPVKRYKHFEAAYLNGELDPYFETLSVQNLRMVVDCNAPDDQIAWGRQMLRDYHPDFVWWEPHEWRYTKICPSDVKYNKPQWWKNPRDYKQLISGGGLCGPRAWFARYISKIHGIPTWGIRVPGHASYSKWEPEGWRNPLGKTWWHGNWDDSWHGKRDAFDFFDEVKISRAHGEEVNFSRVDILEWFGSVMGEKQEGSVPDPEYPWNALALMQRKRLADEIDKCPVVQLPSSPEVMSKGAVLAARPEEKEEISYGGKEIIIPASTRESDSNCTCMKSFLGGNQMLMSEAFEATYKICVPDRKKYKLTMRVATAHRHVETPYKLSVSGSNGKDEYSIPFVYTEGIWAETEPVEIEVGGCEETFKLSREKPCFCTAVKHFKLTPA